MTGWGENGRAWGDDEFWMDFLIQGIGWVLLSLSIGITAWIFYRQRQAAQEAARLLHRRERRAATVHALSRLCSDTGREAVGMDLNIKRGNKATVLNSLAKLDQYHGDLIYYGTLTMRSPLSGLLAEACEDVSSFVSNLNKAVDAVDEIPSDWAECADRYGSRVWHRMMNLIASVEHWIEDGTIPSQPEWQDLPPVSFVVLDQQKKSPEPTT
jgi:hypothetical protein